MAAGSEVWGGHASNWLTDSQTAQHRERERERERGRVGGTADPTPLTDAWCQIQDSQLQKIFTLNSAFAAANELFLRAAVLFAATKLYTAH